MSLGYKLNCFNSVCPNKSMFKKERKKPTVVFNHQLPAGT